MKLHLRTNLRWNLLLIAAALKSARSQESSIPSIVPSDVPSSVPASTTSQLPSLSPAPGIIGPTTAAPVAAPKTCAFSFNTGRCGSLMANVPSTERCDCYTFCGNSFIGCKDFDESTAPAIPQECGDFNQVVGGCTTADRNDGGSSTSGSSSSISFFPAMVIAAAGGLALA